MERKIKNPQIRKLIESNKDKVGVWSGEHASVPTYRAVEEFRAANFAPAFKKRIKESYHELATDGHAHNRYRQALPTGIKNIVNASLKQLMEKKQLSR